MTVKINETEIKVKFSFRADIIFENITNKTFEGKNETEWITYFYSNLVAVKGDLTFDDYIDWLDDNPQELSNFITAYVERQKQIAGITAKEEGDKESTDTF